MTRQVLLRKIMSAGDDIRRLEQGITALQSVDVVEYPENYSALSREAAIRGEIITQKLRRLIYETTDSTKQEYDVCAANALGISIKEESGMIEITMPCLLPKRKKICAGYITDPLYAALSDFVSQRPIEKTFERFGKCIICVTHIYDKVLGIKGRVRDHDNIELKGILDVINAFLLTDDSGDLCDIYNTSTISDDDKTLITIMNRDMFPAWILQHQKSP